MSVSVGKLAGRPKPWSQLVPSAASAVEGKAPGPELLSIVRARAWWAGMALENRALVLRRGGEAVRQLDVYGGPPSYRLHVKSLCTIC